jgi:hypothetical protein
MASLCRPQAMHLKLAAMPEHASSCVDCPEVCQTLYACDMTDWLEVYSYSHGAPLRSVTIKKPSL